MRPRSVLASVVFAALVVSAGAATLTCSKKSRPALEIDPSPMDWGTHTWGENPEMGFKVTNRGDHVVNMQDPTFNCPCFGLTAPPVKSRLEPGESVEMRLVMRTKLKPAGRFHKTMTIASDDPVRAKVDTAIVGDVVDFRKIEPSEVAFGAIPAAGPTQAKLVTVRGDAGSTVKVVSAVSGDEKRVAVDVKPVEGGADLRVRTVAGAEKGRFSVQVRLTLEVRTGDGAAHTYSELVYVTGAVE